MKMKKILALGVVAMMAFSTVANAAVYSDTDGYACIDKMPSKTEIESRKSNLVIDVNQVTLDEIKALGITSLGKGEPALSEDIHDFYKITVDLTNLGDLIDGVEDIDPYNGAKVQFASVLLYLNGMYGNDILKTNVTGGAVNGAAWTLTNTINDLYKALVFAIDISTNVYPQATTDEGIYVENFGFDRVTAGVVVNEGVEFTSVPTIEVSYSTTYTVNNVDSKDSPMAKTFNLTSTTNGEANDGTVVLKAAAPAAATPIEASATLLTSATKADAQGKKAANGYIWQIDFTKNFANLTSFKAQFATATETARERDIKAEDVAAIVTALGGADGTVSLKVGLETSKTLTSAVFTADDADDTTDACVINAKVE